MRLRISILILILPLLFSVAAFAQTVDDLINKNIKAHGGLDKMKAINSMRVTGKIQAQAGIEIPLTVTKKRPDLMRVDVTVQGKNLAQAYDGKIGWQTPFMGTDVQKMTEDDLKDMEEQADFDGPLVDYKAKGNAVELVGKEDMEGTDTYKLKLTLKNGNVRYIYLDAENYLELKSSGKTKHEGTEYDGETLFSNFQTVDGFVIPFSIEGKINGQTTQQITITKVETNVPVDDSIFKMPAATQSQPAKP